MPQIAVPPDVLAVARKIQNAGFACVLVGGPVRDALLGRTAKDWDLATSATLPEMARLFSRHRGQTRYGTTLVPAGRDIIEVTTFRTEGDYTDHRRPDTVVFTDSLETDLSRRDFTMNALAYDPIAGSLVDPFGGIADLRTRRIRAVGRASERFTEDALRMLRAVRFAGQLGFTIDPGTAAAIERAAPTARRLASERIGAELHKLVVAPYAGAGLRAMADLGLVGPSLRTVRDSTRFRHGIDLLEQAPGDPVDRFAALFHHLGGSDAARDARALLVALGLGDTLGLPVERRLRVVSAGELRDDRALARLIGSVGPDVFRAGVELRRECLATGGLSTAPADLLRRRADTLLRLGRPTRVVDLAINGDDLRAIGIRPGPTMGRILNSLLDSAATGRLRNERRTLLDAARKLAA